MHCTALHCTALNCTAPHCTELHCTVMNYTALQCNALYFTALNFTVLNCLALILRPCIVHESATLPALYIAMNVTTALHCTALHYTTPLHCSSNSCAVHNVVHLLNEYLHCKHPAHSCVVGCKERGRVSTCTYYLDIAPHSPP